MLCETEVQQTALMQCQLMILSFRWRRCGGKWGRVSALFKHVRFCDLWPSDSLKKGKRRDAVRKTVTGMMHFCHCLVQSLCMLASMSWGHAGNICCLGAPGLTLKMRKDSTSRGVFSLKWACHCVYGSAYWQVSCGPPNVETYTQTEGAANKVLPAEIPLADHKAPYAPLPTNPPPSPNWIISSH